MSWRRGDRSWRPPEPVNVQHGGSSSSTAPPPATGAADQPAHPSGSTRPRQPEHASGSTRPRDDADEDYDEPTEWNGEMWQRHRTTGWWRQVEEQRRGVRLRSRTYSPSPSRSVQRCGAANFHIKLVTLGAQYHISVDEAAMQEGINTPLCVDLRGLDDPGRDRDLHRHLGTHVTTMTRIKNHRFFRDTCVRKCVEAIRAAMRDGSATLVIGCHRGRHRSIAACMLFFHAMLKMLDNDWALEVDHRGDWSRTCQGACDTCSHPEQHVSLLAEVVDMLQEEMLQQGVSLSGSTRPRGRSGSARPRGRSQNDSPRSANHSRSRSISRSEAGALREAIEMLQGEVRSLRRQMPGPRGPRRSHRRRRHHHRQRPRARHSHRRRRRHGGHQAHQMARHHLRGPRRHRHPGTPGPRRDP